MLKAVHSHVKCGSILLYKYDNPPNIQWLCEAWDNADIVPEEH